MVVLDAFVGNFYRIRSALSYGTEKLNDILMLPPAKIAGGLETFFVNTLERNGRGRRADLLVPVPAYGAGWSETLSSIEDSDDLLTGIEYDLWFNGYGILSPIQLNPFATPQVWSDEWVEMGQNMPFDQNIYYDVYGSPPSSVDSPLSLQLTNAVSEEEKEKFRGTGLCIPHLVICFFPSELLLSCTCFWHSAFCHAILDYITWSLRHKCSSGF